MAVSKFSAPEHAITNRGLEAYSAYTQIISTPSSAPKSTTDISPKCSHAPPPEVPPAIKTVKLISKKDIFKNAQIGNLPLTKDYIENGGKINLADEYGWTLLMVAACEGHLSIVKYLCENGADRNLLTKNRLSVLDIALSKNNASIVNYLKYQSFPKPKLKKPKVWPQIKLIEKMSESNFCDICDVSYNSSVAKHLTSISHQLNLPPVTPRTIYHIPPSNKGYQMLRQAGWKDEEGLGPNNDGSKYPVKTRLKHNRLGLGHALDSKPRITHFKPYDALSIKDPYRKPQPHVETKKEMLKKKAEERRKEVYWRRQLSEL